MQGKPSNNCKVNLVVLQGKPSSIDISFYIMYLKALKDLKKRVCASAPVCARMN